MTSRIKIKRRHDSPKDAELERLGRLVKELEENNRRLQNENNRYSSELVGALGIKTNKPEINPNDIMGALANDNKIVTFHIDCHSGDAEISTYLTIEDEKKGTLVQSQLTPVYRIREADTYKSVFRVSVG